MKNVKKQTTAKKTPAKKISPMAEEDAIYSTAMKPSEFDKRTDNAAYLAIPIEFKTRFFEWFKYTAKKEPTYGDYTHFLMAISVAKTQPDRPKAKNIKAQLEAFSNAIDHMDDFTTKKLAGEVARRIAKTEKEMDSERVRNGGRRREANSLSNFMENPYQVCDFLIEIYDVSYKVAFEVAQKKVAKKTIERDRAKTVVQLLVDDYKRFSVGEPGTAATSPFTKLVRIAFDAIGYPSEDPTRLTKEVLKQRNSHPRKQVNIDCWDV